MSFRNNADIKGDDAWRSRERCRRRREWMIQGLVLLGVFIVGGFFYLNVENNLAEKHIASGMGFLMHRAGFEISDQLVSYTANDPFWKAFLVGLLNTLKVAGLTVISATVLGIIVGLMRLSRNPLLRMLGVAHVEVYRNIPLLVLLLAFYLVVTEILPSVRDAFHIGSWVYLSKTGLLAAVPKEGGMALLAGLATGVVAAFAGYRLLSVKLTSLVAAFSAVAIFAVAFLLGWALTGCITGWEHPTATRFAMRGGLQITPEFLTLWLGLTLFTSASVAEIVRAGVESVRREQWDAGMALGFTHSQTVSFVVFPQALRLIVPPLSSQFMTLTKNSSLAVMVGYPDLVNVGTTTLNITGQALEVILIIMAVYLTINLIISVVMNALNARVTAVRI